MSAAVDSGLPEAALPEHVRRIAASAWKIRWRVELEAEARFARLAGRLEQIGAARAMVEPGPPRRPG